MRERGKGGGRKRGAFTHACPSRPLSSGFVLGPSSLRPTTRDGRDSAHEAAELKKKQEAAIKKAAEQEELDRINAEKDAKLAAEGKRAAGGLHKFDPDEVDV